MKVRQIHEQGSGSMNEDQLLIGENIFAVFDGATSLNKYVDSNGLTGGFIASLTAKEVFERNDESLTDLAQEANVALAGKMLSAGINMSDKANRWATSMAAIRLNEQSVEWLTLSDSVIIAIRKDSRYELLGGYHDHDAETMLKWQECANQKVESIRECLLPTIIENRRKMNVTYGVLDGEPEAISFIQQGTTQLDDIAHIVLTTDGLFIPTEASKEPDWDTFVKFYLAGGLEAVRDVVRERENSDPEMWVYPRTKHSDDIGAIALQF